MSDGSRIEWTQATWNPVTGCTRISPGCDRCYIERTPPFRMTGRRFDRPGTGGTTGIRLHPDRLGQPLRWRRPRRVFVASLADLLHPAVPDAVLAEVWAVMAASPRHTFQILTKRHARLRAWLTGPAQPAVRATAPALPAVRATAPALPAGLRWPLSNVWVGVSAETQQWADVRIPALLAAPAAVRWVSAEPLLGTLDLTRWLHPRPGAGLDWVVVGGESGPGARPMDLDAVTSLVQQCRQARVPVFVKQLGTRHGRGHHDIETFPAPLRVRQYPAVHEAVTRCRA